MLVKVLALVCIGLALCRLCLLPGEVPLSQQLEGWPNWLTVLLTLTISLPLQCTAHQPG